MTEAEIRAALQVAWDAARNVPDSGGAMTRVEIDDAMGWPRNRSSEFIRKMVRAGEWEHVKVPRKMITGSVRLADAYRPVQSA